MQKRDVTSFFLALLVCAGLGWGGSVFAADRVVEAGLETPTPVSLTGYFAVLEDNDKGLTLADVQEPERAARFTANPQGGDALNFGYSSAAYWLRLTLHNASDAPVLRMLEVRHPGLSSVEFHQPGAAGSPPAVRTGSLQPFASRPYANRFFVFPLSLPAHAQQTVFLRIQSNGPIAVPAMLWQVPAFHAHERADYGGQAWYFGIVTAMGLFNLLLFIALRDRVYVLYVAFVSCMSLTIAVQNGLANEYLWTDSPWWINIALNVGYSTSLAVLLLFMRRMLGLRKMAPRVDKSLRLLIGLFFLLPVGFAFALPLFIKPAAMLYAATGILILVLGVWCSFQRQRSAYFFVAAYFSLCFAAVVTVFKAWGWLPTNTLTVNALQYGSALEMLLLAFALADRFNAIRLERARAQHESLRAKQSLVDALQTSERELELRVQQRTAELDIKNAELEQAMASLETVERIARHDLKTPLGSLAAAPSLLRAGRVMSAHEEKVLGMMESAANRALSMVNLSLDLYRMETGNYVAQAARVDLMAVVQAVVQDLEVHARSIGVTVQVSGPAQPVLAYAQESLCYSIVANLVKNAIEAAPPQSRVDIVLQAEPVVSLSISNQGAVPEALRANFFAKYSTAGKLGGSGLGTYSSHLLARVQGGDLTMETSEATGTRLTLVLLRWNPREDASAALAPLVPVPVPVVSAAVAVPLSPLRVLVVDDDEFNRLVLLAQLPQPPLTVDTAVNGREALEAVGRQHYSVIIMDIEMPVMGGIEALKRIRALQAKSGQTPSRIVAYSANDSAQNHADYLAQGFDKCLSKPGSQETVMALFAEQSRQEARPAD